MSVATEAVAFLGTEGVITTTTIAVIGVRLLARASVTTARTGGTGRRNSTRATVPGADAARAPLAPVDSEKAEEAAA